MKVLAVTNMLPSEWNPKAGSFVERQIEGLRSIGLEVDVLLIDRASRGMFEYRKTGKVVRERISLGRPDVIHVMYGGLMAELATRASEATPRVLSLCGTDLLGEPAGSPVRLLRGHVGVWCSHRAAMRADRIVVKSQNLLENLPERIDRRLVTIIPNGVDMWRFRPLDHQESQKELGWAPGVFHVLFSTPNSKDVNKRRSLAAAAVEALRKRSIAAELHVMTRTPHEQVPIWLNAADAVLLTSIQEGSPNIVKEALACNRPVVSVDVGDVKERINGIDGCYLCAATAEDLAGALVRVSQEPRQIAGRARMQELSLERVASRLAVVYDEAAARFRSKA